jgi:putative nucleotidyltransferase with HDIG domain
MISREEAKELLKRHLKSDNLRKHCLATAAVMEGLAERLGEDKETWFITGLLHDIDFEMVEDDFSQHGARAMELLQEADITPEMKHAIQAHTELVPIETNLDRGLWIADPVNGLIVAAALMRPDKRISTMELKSLKKKYKTKSFAAGTSREQMADCTALGLELNDFLQLALDAMSKYEEELGFG